MEEEPVKKKPQKPPVAPGTKKRKLKRGKSDSSNEDNQFALIKKKSIKRRRSSGRGMANNYERLLKHRESRTGSKEELLAIEYAGENYGNV